MTSKFRRKLSIGDMHHADDDEMDDLLGAENTPNVDEDLIEDENNEDFFLNGPKPILSLLKEVEETEGKSIPKSKSVRFQVPEVELEGTEHGEANHTIHHSKKQIDEVTEVMKNNIERLLDRESDLDYLAEMSDQMNFSSDIYHQSVDHLRRKRKWRQARTRLVFSALLSIILFIIVIYIVSLIV